MAQPLSGRNPLSYLGVEAITPPNMIVSPTSPTPSDSRNVTIGDMWINRNTQNFYVLTSLSGGVATWTLVEGSSANQFETDDSNIAVPIGGLLILHGAGDVVTSSAGNIVTITGSGLITADTDSGSATVSSNTLSFVGGSGISTSAAGSTVTITATGGGTITTLVGDDGGTASGSSVNIITGFTSGPGQNGTPFFSGDNASTLRWQSYDANGNLSIGRFPLGQTGSMTNNTNTVYGNAAGSNANFLTNNCFFGAEAAGTMVYGTSNCVFGRLALGFLIGDALSLPAPQFNIAIGDEAGINLTTTESNNIYFNSPGVIAESNVLRIGSGTGTGSQQLNAAFISGIQGINVGSVASVVSINGDQLGTTTITAGSNITVTPGAGTITIAASGGGGGVTQLDGNTGFAVPIAGVIHVETSVGEGTSRFTGSGGGTLILGFGDTNNNTGIGGNVLAALTSGTNLTALGRGSLESVDTGTHNCAFGVDTLDVTSGSYNVAVGFDAGSAYTSTESSNIVINSTGTIAESNTLRIGAGTGTGTQQLDSAFISGIQGITVTGTPILISSSDQLGIAVSSRRFKTDIQDMGISSSVIQKLRPVSFVWNQNSAPGLKDATTMRQYGLIAEEALEHVPHVVNTGHDGQPLNINYQDLIGMMINEIQILRKEVDALKKGAS